MNASQVKGGILRERVKILLRQGYRKGQKGRSLYDAAKDLLGVSYNIARRRVDDYCSDLVQ